MFLTRGEHKDSGAARKRLRGRMSGSSDFFRPSAPVEKQGDRKLHRDDAAGLQEAPDLL